MNGNERSERKVLLQWTEMNAENKPLSCKKNFWTFRSFFTFIFEFFAIFEPLLTPKRPFIGNFWGLLGPDLTEMNETFFLQNKNERRERNGSFSLNGNERRERNIHLNWTEMNAENETFI